MRKSNDTIVRNADFSRIEPQDAERITGERRLAIVLATLLGSFSVLWVINFKVVAIDRVLTLLR